MHTIYVHCKLFLAVRNSDALKVEENQIAKNSLIKTTHVENFKLKGINESIYLNTLWIILTLFSHSLHLSRFKIRDDVDSVVCHLDVPVKISIKWKQSFRDSIRDCVECLTH
jgi:hypothetical protein